MATTAKFAAIQNIANLTISDIRGYSYLALAKSGVGVSVLNIKSALHAPQRVFYCVNSVHQNYGGLDGGAAMLAGSLGR